VFGGWDSGNEDAGSDYGAEGFMAENRIVELPGDSMSESFMRMQMDYVPLEALSNRIMARGAGERVGTSGSGNVVCASGSVTSDVPVAVPLPRKNKMNLYELEKLRWEYGIPKYVGLRLPEEGESVRYPDDGSVMICPDYFKHGFRLPLHPWVHSMLVRLGYAPGQYNPNFWILLHGVYIAWWLAGLGEPSFDQFMYLYSVTRQQGKQGWVQANCRLASQRGHFITNMPSSQKAWRNRWFIVTSLTLI